MHADDASLPDEAEPDSPAQAGDSAWWRWRESGDLRARDDIAKQHLHFTRIVAARVYAGRQSDDVDFNEYLQLGSVGLMEAIDRYDPSQSASFRTYASHRIRGAILNGLSQLTERQRQIDVRQRLRRERIESLRASESSGSETQDEEERPGVEQLRANALFRELAEVGVGVALTILLEDSGLIAGHDGIGPERYFRSAELAQLRARLKDAATRLPERERQIIALHYDEDVPFTEIAERLQLSKGRIAQLHRRALLALRETLQAGELGDRWL